MVKTSNLPFLIDDKDIIRGKIFRTAFPFLEGRPLQFFEQCADCKDCKHHGTGHDYCGKVTEKPYGFEDSHDKTLYVVNRFKARHAIILSTQTLNENPHWPNIIVAPIVGIHDDELDKPKIKKIMSRDLKYFTAYYLEPSITGAHCFIDLGKIRPIPKNWLLQDKAILADNKMFDEISNRIGIILSQKSLEQCDGCKKPCENCDLKTEIEFLKKQLKQIGA